MSYLPMSDAEGRKRVPLWHRIEGVLRHQISTGEYRAGEALPSEPSLAASFGVNRVTIREALRSLAADGLIQQIQGKGTFVLPQAGQERNAALMTAAVGELTFNEAFPALSPDPDYRAPECSFIGVERMEAPSDVRAELKSEEAAVVRVERVVTSRGEPFLYVLDYLPLDVGSRITEEEVSRLWLTQLLVDRLGYRITEARQTIQAVLADVVIGDRLGVPFGAPLLHARRVYMDQSGRPLYVARSWYRGDRFQYGMVYRYQSPGSRG